MNDRRALFSFCDPCRSRVGGPAVGFVHLTIVGFELVASIWRVFEEEEKKQKKDYGADVGDDERIIAWMIAERESERECVKEREIEWKTKEVNV